MEDIHKIREYNYEVTKEREQIKNDKSVSDIVSEIKKDVVKK